MKIISLLDNVADHDQTSDLKSCHGMSLYVETKKHTILIDTGPNSLFIENAQKLGIDLGSVDIVIITHGHNDHGGGLKDFLAVNKKAIVYVQSSAFLKHYVKVLGFLKVDVGLSQELKQRSQVVLVDGDVVIDDEITLVSNPSGKKHMPIFNGTLYEKTILENKKTKVVRDQFNHEQSVLITADKTVLIGGCAHRGIANIVEAAINKAKTRIDVCISGFHLYSPSSGKVENEESIIQLASELDHKGIIYYTCHCTGLKAYNIMKLQMKQIDYLKTGQSILI